MARVYVSSVINGRSDRVWQRIRDFNGLPSWHPGIAESRIENGERGTPDPAEAAAKLGVPLPDLIAPCPQCGYQPPHGYLCLRCGTQAARQAG